MKKMAHERLKFIDESGVTTGLTGLFGRAAPGVRVRERVPKNYGQSTSVVSLIGIGGVETTMLVQGAFDTLVFDAFGENFVRPCLKAGDILVSDNVRSAPSEPHRRNGGELRGASHLAAALLARLFAD